VLFEILGDDLLDLEGRAVPAGDLHVVDRVGGSQRVEDFEDRDAEALRPAGVE